MVTLWLQSKSVYENCQKRRNFIFFSSFFSQIISTLIIKLQLTK
jgi:hypothetical protein